MPRTAASTVAAGLGDPAPYLLPAEIVVIGVRRHVLVLGAAALETIGFIAAALMLQYLFEYTPLVDRIGAVLILGALIRMIYLVIEWRMERFVVSNHRMILISGVISRRVAAVPLRKITDLTFEKPLIGQVFGYGTFIIESAGQDQAMSRVAYLPHANRLYLKVSDLLFGRGMPAVEADLVVDPPNPKAMVSSEPSATTSEPSWDIAVDRQDTDPALGEKLAGVDFTLPPEDHGLDPAPMPTAATGHEHPDDYDVEDEALHSTAPIALPGLRERPRNEATHRLLNNLAGVHGRGTRRGPGGDPLLEARPPRWVRRG